MGPTLFREGPFRFFFFSREEPRPHVHAISADGEAKYWLEPEVELARNYGLSSRDLGLRDLGLIEEIILTRREEILNAWNRHFGR
jgi:hypothetical protein